MAEILPYSKAAILEKTEWFFSGSITITGAAATGTSTVSHTLFERLGHPWRLVSAGRLMRQQAKKLGLATIEEFVTYCQEQPNQDHDRKCDGKIADFGRQNQVITEARLGHVFVPQAFHVLLECPIDIRAQRRQAQLTGKSFDQVVDLLSRRDDADQARFDSLYPGSTWPASDFDLVINTASLLPGQIVNEITQAHLTWRWNSTNERKITEEVVLS